jgi:hypothetical protein
VVVVVVVVVVGVVAGRGAGGAGLPSSMFLVQAGPWRGVTVVWLGMPAHCCQSRRRRASPFLSRLI